VRVARGPFIRPLLECRRADLRSYLAARGETACEDSSNADRSIPRNRIRHELLPVIEHLAPGGIPALARAAALAADDERFLTQTAIASASSVVLLDSDGVQLKCEPLSALPPAVARRVVRLAIERVSTRGRLAARHIEALRRLASRIEPFGHIDLPGATVERRADRLVVRAGRMKAPAAFHRELTLPGETRLAGVDVDSVETRVEARFQDGVDLATLASRDPWQVVIQADAVALPLVARSRRPGDRLKPLGAPGRRKLQDVFVDRKVPRSTRDQVPVIVDSTGRLVWVVGVAMADECRVTAPEAKVIILTVRNT
jgi:tRNA(Ile)-lysidine synthase